MPKSSIKLINPLGNAHGYVSNLSDHEDLISGDPLQASLLRRDTNTEVDSRKSYSLLTWGALERNSADGVSSAVQACTGGAREALLRDWRIVPRTLGDF